MMLVRRVCVWGGAVTSRMILLESNQNIECQWFCNITMIYKKK